MRTAGEFRRRAHYSYPVVFHLYASASETTRRLPRALAWRTRVERSRQGEGRQGKSSVCCRLTGQLYSG